MRSVVGALPIVLGLLLAAGCALPQAKVTRTDDFAPRSKKTTKTSTDNSASSNDKIAFKAPQRNQASNTNAQGGSAASTDSQTASTTNSAGDTATSDAGSARSSQWTDEDEEFFQNSGSSDRRRQPIKQVNNDQWTDPDSESPIQLQGVEVENNGSTNSIQSRSSKNSDLRIASNNPDQRLDLPVAPLTGQQADVRQTGSLPSPNGGPVFGDAIGAWTNDKRDGGQNTPQIRPWSERLAQDRNDGFASLSTTTPGIPAVRPNMSPVNSSNSLQGNGLQGDLPALPWQTELDRLIAHVEQRLSQVPQAQRDSEYLRMQAHLRMLYLMAQRQEDALTAIPGIGSSQQEYWQQMVWAMGNSLDTSQFPDAADRAAHTILPLSTALRQMREQSPLLIKNMAFCRKISSFGDYERFPRNEFAPGYEVLLYTEIENFVSSPTGDGEYRTSLKSHIEIIDARGNVVWSRGFAPTEDFCRNPRRDYFHNCQLHIPDDLPTGAYSLKLTISDELGRKQSSNSLNFVLK